MHFMKITKVPNRIISVEKHIAHKCSDVAYISVKTCKKV